MYHKDILIKVDNKNNLILVSKKMRSIIKMIDRIAHINSTILISGESGTGKSVLAKYVHAKSNRSAGPLVIINCTTIPEGLLESELFGYAPGAFTGASKHGKIGLVESANGGTLFLDEIGEIPLPLQAKFLELIQEKQFTPVGGTNKKTIDIRIVAATNANLSKLVESKAFREDLYYRIKVIDLTIPPLRERIEDIDELINYYLKKFTYEYNLPHILPIETREILKLYNWPGNIRELQHIIEQLVVTIHDQIINPSSIPSYILKSIEPDKIIGYEELPKLDEAIFEVEKKLIMKAFSQYGSSYKVAEVLGISQSKAIRLYRKHR